jgi:predicted DNA-binding protein (MmcQ/YjbR family)
MTANLLLRVEAELREFALGYPGTHEDFPWGERAIKVNKKTFLFMRCDGDALSLSTKLPVSREEALSMPFAEPTHYGLGKSGWVTAAFGPGERPPVKTLRKWIDESYRAVATKRLIAQRDAGANATPAIATNKRKSS